MNSRYEHTPDPVESFEAFGIQSRQKASYSEKNARSQGFDYFFAEERVALQAIEVTTT
jgi:hypothetical protein